jgi:hypothetical protein
MSAGLVLSQDAPDHVGEAGLERPSDAQSLMPQYLQRPRAFSSETEESYAQVLHMNGFNHVENVEIPLRPKPAVDRIDHGALPFRPALATPLSFDEPFSDDMSQPPQHVTPSSSPPPPPPPPPPPEILAASARFAPRNLGVGIRMHSQRRAMSIKRIPSRRPPVPRQVSIDSNVLVASQGRFLQLVKEIIDDQTRLVNKRVSARNRRNDLKAQLPNYLAAYYGLRAFFEHALAEIAKSNMPDHIKTQLPNRWSKVEGVSQTIKDWQGLLEQDEDDVHKLESRCLAKEAELARLLKSLDPNSALDAEEGSSQTFSETFFATVSRAASVSSSSSGSTVTVRQKYLRTIGNINLLRDRIFNLDSEIRLQMIKRGEDQYSSRPVKISDDEFLADYRTRREAIIQEYWSSKAEMEKLGDRCLEEGVPVQPANLPLYIDQLFSRNHDVISPAPAKKSPYDMPDTARNIIRWVRHVQKMSQSESVSATGATMTDREVEELLPLPQYQNLQASTDLDLPTLALSNTHSAPHPRNFEGEIPTARRRYSAPALSCQVFDKRVTLALNRLDASAPRIRRKRRDHKLPARQASSEA